ncbi:hypothetical protein TR2A62_1266 [Thalassobium sp. R2A62]|nr:hypothetical protein TR2A62_1266 [Thalassobium sp. R2A62]
MVLSIWSVPYCPDTDENSELLRMHNGLDSNAAMQQMHK